MKSWPGSRKEAVAAGDKYYQIGRPCKRGHQGPHYVSTRMCAECNRARVRAYQESHPDKHRTSRAVHRKKNADRINAACAAWVKRNPAARSAMKARRRARLANAGGEGVTAEQWRDVLAGSLGICAYCNERRPLAMDHIEPLARGGEHDCANVAAACSLCNSSKGDTPLLLWLAKRRMAA